MQKKHLIKLTPIYDKKKTLKKEGTEETYLNITKPIYDKTTANMIFNCKKLKAFLLNLEQDKMPTLTTSIQHNTGSPHFSNQTRKRNKRYSNWQGRGNTVII